MANHTDPRTTKLYDRRKDLATLSEIERRHRVLNERSFLGCEPDFNARLDAGGRESPTERRRNA